jgi:hypothetical protein
MLTKDSFARFISILFCVFLFSSCFPNNYEDLDYDSFIGGELSDYIDMLDSYDDPDDCDESDEYDDSFDYDANFIEIDKDVNLLGQAYLCKGELDPNLISKCFFPYMTPNQVNTSLRDIRRFIEKFTRVAVKKDVRLVGEKFLTDILHTYGHVINFIDNSWVDRRTNRIVVAKKNKDWVPNADPLVDCWWYMEQTQGAKLHMYKFYASCIDYLTIMIRAYLLFPCRDYNQLCEMDNRWLWWIEKVTCKLHENSVFGGYYQENVKLFREVYMLWKRDFDEHMKSKNYWENIYD